MTPEQMMKRQQVLAEFGEFALRSEDLDEVLTEACRLVGEALGTHRAKVLEIQDDGQWLFVRAGVGWPDHVVGHVRLSMDEQSSETVSIREARPVIVQDISKDDRFDVPQFMKEAGVVALANVPILVPGRKPYGLLQVDDDTPRDFGHEDTEFLRTYAMILGPVIDRLHKVHDLRTALDANQRLMRELQHRIKNHIGIIASLVQMRAMEVASEEARQELSALGERIETLRLVHEQLYAANTAERLSLRPYLTQLVENLRRLYQRQASDVQIDVDVEEVDLTPEVAVPLGLIVNEFATNSLKHAFNGNGGQIGVRLERLEDDVLRVRLSDNGKGLPAEPDPATSGSGTGLTLIEGLADQIGAEPRWSSGPGAVLELEFKPF